MITPLNALRHRVRFAIWTAWLRVQLRRRDSELKVDAPHGARIEGWPHVDVRAIGEGPGSLYLRIGRGVSLGRALHLEVWAGGTNRLELGDGMYFLHGARVELRGGTVVLGAHTTVRDGAVLRSEGELRVGEHVLISFGDVLACTQRIEVGDHCGLAERVSITDSDHTHDGSDRRYSHQPLRVAPVRLGRNVLVSANAVVLRGAEIGDNAVIGAGAVVRRGEHPGGWLHTGAPAKPAKRLGN